MVKAMFPWVTTSPPSWSSAVCISSSFSSFTFTSTPASFASFARFSLGKSRVSSKPSPSRRGRYERTNNTCTGLTRYQASVVAMQESFIYPSFLLLFHQVTHIEWGSHFLATNFIETFQLQDVTGVQHLQQIYISLKLKLLRKVVLTLARSDFLHLKASRALQYTGQCRYIPKRTRTSVL